MANGSALYSAAAKNTRVKPVSYTHLDVYKRQLINAKLDIVLGNDITTPVAINEFEKAGFDSVFDRTRVNIVLDHFVPNKDIKSATQSKQCRQFADKYDILNFYDVGQMGVEHALLRCV